ncbi:uncharacterized protein LOC121246188 [Juglans microcarpa x Juglans regia]|uniref:uncharacterized protein LOC121246188 n=1 Tax=Juglans microcarpa x Juglans regia TaxID=2249226 RepID=UPI001B7E8400|nr:uncharacterized protein LOC121246188 [Juglans microcarpa x Juglans regia]
MTKNAPALISSSIGLERMMAAWEAKQLLTVANIDRFLVVPNRAHVWGRKLKAVAPLATRCASQSADPPQKHPNCSEDGESETTDSSVEPKVELARVVVFDSTVAVGSETPRGYPVRVSPPTSLGLGDLNGLMGQALVDLATTFDFDLPPKRYCSTGTSPFEFPSLPSSTLTLSGGEISKDIYYTFSMGVSGIVTLAATETCGGQDSTLSSPFLRSSRGVKPH